MERDELSSRMKYLMIYLTKQIVQLPLGLPVLGFIPLFFARKPCSTRSCFISAISSNAQWSGVEHSLHYSARKKILNYWKGFFVDLPFECCKHRRASHPFEDRNQNNWRAHVFLIYLFFDSINIDSSSLFDVVCAAEVNKVYCINIKRTFHKKKTAQRFEAICKATILILDSRFYERCIWQAKGCLHSGVEEASAHISS